MDPVAILLLAIAAIFVVGTLGELVFERTGIPDVIWLILVGVAVGPVGGLITRTELIDVAPYLAAFTLIVILFEGGSRIPLDQLRASAGRASLLALVGFLLAVTGVAGVTQVLAAFGGMPDGWTLGHGILAGCILGGSSSVIIMPTLARAKLEPVLSSTLSLESALTDVLCVVGASTMIGLLGSEAASGSPVLALLRSFGLGAGAGVVAGLVWMVVLALLHTSERSYPLTLAALLALYVAVDEIGGSAALAVLGFAVVVGNGQLIGRKLNLGVDADLRTDVRGFNQQMAFMIKSFFFTFIGLMLGPPWRLIALGLGLAAALYLTRVVAARIACSGNGWDRPRRSLIAVALPRGMAAGVLATMPATAGVPATESLPVTVFAAVVGTILIFVFGFPRFSARLPAPD
jgi:cell volume regulation protein A